MNSLNALSGKFSGVIATPGSSISSMNSFSSMPASLAASTVNIKVPASVGMPEIVPVNESNTSPSGNLPPINSDSESGSDKAQLIGFEPSASMTNSYGSSNIPAGIA